jgi:hypothetical protein
VRQARPLACRRERGARRDDPKMEKVPCYMSRAETGGMKGGLVLADIVSIRAPLAAAQPFGKHLK